MSLLQAPGTSLIASAENLADAIHALAQWPKTHENSKRTAASLFKLPPALSTDVNGRRNLIAMIKAMSDYENGCADGTVLTLNDLPAQFNKYGGRPALTEKDMRRVHNWLQQVSFGIRAAYVSSYCNNNNSRFASENYRDSIAKMIDDELYGGARSKFVTYSLDNKYELKPLRFATQEARCRWINQEIKQYVNGEAYGVRPSEMEWEIFGLRGHCRTACAEIRKEIDELIRRADALDARAQYEDSDALVSRMLLLQRNLHEFERMDSTD